MAKRYALISALESSLRLHRHRDGTLAGPAAYLHDRSGGMISNLLRLVRAAAAMLNGTEAITKATLDSVPVGIASAGEHLPG